MRPLWDFHCTGRHLHLFGKRQSEFYMKCCTAVLGSASYQEICCFTAALVFLAPTIYLKQRSKAKYQISDWFSTHLCCRNLMAFFLTATDAAFSRALWTGAGKYRQVVQSLQMDAAYFIPADSKDNLYNPSDELPLFNLPVAYTKHRPSMQQGMSD